MSSIPLNRKKKKMGMRLRFQSVGKLMDFLRDKSWWIAQKFREFERSIASEGIAKSIAFYVKHSNRYDRGFERRQAPNGTVNSIALQLIHSKRQDLIFAV